MNKLKFASRVAALLSTPVESCPDDTDLLTEIYRAAFEEEIVDLNEKGKVVEYAGVRGD